MLHSAAKNRFRMRNQEDKENALQTPAALKPGFFLSSPNIPDATMLSNSSMIDASETPMVPLDSSTAMSTPMATLAKHGEMALDGGNILTLKEQEAVRCHNVCVQTWNVANYRYRKSRKSTRRTLV